MRKAIGGMTLIGGCIVMIIISVTQSSEVRDYLPVIIASCMGIMIGVSLICCDLYCCLIPIRSRPASSGHATYSCPAATAPDDGINNATEGHNYIRIQDEKLVLG